LAVTAVVLTCKATLVTPVGKAMLPAAADPHTAGDAELEQFDVELNDGCVTVPVNVGDGSRETVTEPSIGLLTTPILEPGRMLCVEYTALMSIVAGTIVFQAFAVMVVCQSGMEPTGHVFATNPAAVEQPLQVIVSAPFMPRKNVPLLKYQPVVSLEDVPEMVAVIGAVRTVTTLPTRTMQGVLEEQEPPRV
jgi:hypothetical protein